MKKFFSVLFLLCLTSMMIVGAVACGKTPSKTNEQTRQEQTISPRADADGDQPEPPEKCPYLRHRRHKKRAHENECPHCPDARKYKTPAPKAERLPKCSEENCPQEDDSTPNL